MCPNHLFAKQKILTNIFSLFYMSIEKAFTNEIFNHNHRGKMKINVKFLNNLRFLSLRGMAESRKVRGVRKRSSL